MGERGPPPLPDNVKLLRGTLRPDRSHAPEVAPLEGEPIKPGWLPSSAAALWDERAATYRLRGQSVRGCEPLLAHYCCLDAEMIAIWGRGGVPGSGMLAALKAFGCQFYDTPASQIAKASGAPAPAVNPFLNRGQRPSRTSTA